MASKTNPDVIPLSAATHLPTKLNDTNFSVWKKQLESTLFGYNLLGYVTGTLPQPKSTNTDNTPNLDYLLWTRQDQFILSAMLGSCIDTIQPSISTALTSKEAWERLNELHASKSRSRVLSLKAKLIQNPRGTRSIRAYMTEIRTIVDALAIADKPVSDEDVFLSVITQLGPEYRDITAALRARDTALSFDTLVAKLEDAEAQIHAESALPSSMPTANHTTKSQKPQRSSNQPWRPTNNPNRSHSWRPTYSSPGNSPSYNSPRPWSQQNRNNAYCHFCNRPNHHTKDCRQLAKFLTEFGIQPQANATMMQPQQSAPWLFDTGASHHATSDLSSLSSFEPYGGPDVIKLSDGTG